VTALLVVAGEASGDLHGGELLRELRALRPDLRFVGVGGERMTPYLDRKVADVAELSVMGLTEVVRHLPALWRLKGRLGALAREEDCGSALLIDYQDFNRQLARDLRAQRPGMRLHQYVCPQVWAWKKGRIPVIGRRFDVLYCLFDFEPALFAGQPVEARWLGNPLVDLLRPELDRETFFRSLALDPQRPLVALLPGSRRREVALLLPPLVAMVRAWPDPRTQWVLPLAPSLDADLVGSFLGDAPIRTTRATVAARAHAEAALVCSGTATLETALLGTPMALFYRVGALTHFLARRLLSLPHYGLPNILAGRTIVPEFFQDEVTPERLGHELSKLLDPSGAEAMRRDLAQVRQRLGEPGAASRIAAHLAASIGR
jgi:lipid-A-disaccharide synthase